MDPKMEVVSASEARQWRRRARRCGSAKRHESGRTGLADGSVTDGGSARSIRVRNGKIVVFQQNTYYQYYLFFSFYMLQKKQTFMLEGP
jgi:hypothetical protein